jgi:hypothetical protein
MRQVIVQRIQRTDPQTAAQLSARPAGAWAEYTVSEVKFEKPAGFGQLISVVVDRSPAAKQRDEELVLAFGQAGKKASIERLGIRGGALHRVAEVAYDFASLGRPRSSHFALAPDAISFTSQSPGVVLLAGNDVRRFGPEHGAPGNEVLASAWLDGSLYLGYQGALARLEPASGRFTLLASAAAVQKKSPLDGEGVFYVQDILAVPRHECVLFVLSSSRAGISGMWKFTPRTNQWERLLPVSVFISCLRLEEDGTVFCLARPLGSWLKEENRAANISVSSTGHAWLAIDLGQNKITSLPGFTPPVFLQRDVPAIQYARVDDHIVASNGRLFTPGGEFTHPMAGLWKILEPHGHGFLAVYQNEEVIRYFERTGTTAAATPAAGGKKSDENVAPADVRREALKKFAVRFGDTGGIELTRTTGIVNAARAFTIEFWARLATEPTQHQLLSDQVSVEPRDVRGWRLECVSDATGSWRLVLHLNGTTSVPVQMDSQRWHHIAFCHDGAERTQLFVNGEPIIAFTFKSVARPDSPLNLHVGAYAKMLPTQKHGFNGDIRAVRISSQARYLYTFRPPTDFAKDAETELLLDFSQAKGTTIPDISGHGRDGQIVGGTWITLDGNEAP